jgi:hypothetical protein
MNHPIDTAPPPPSRPLRWDEAIVALYLYELARGSHDPD